MTRRSAAKRVAVEPEDLGFIKNREDRRGRAEILRVFCARRDGAGRTRRGVDTTGRTLRILYSSADCGIVLLDYYAMETTRLSTKGQIVVPKRIRSAKAWGAGTEFTVEMHRDGILLKPVARFLRTRLEEVVGCLQYTGKRKTFAQMDDAIGKTVKDRHQRGRY